MSNWHKQRQTKKTRLQDLVEQKNVLLQLFLKTGT